MTSSLEEDISDLHLSLDCGDNAVKTPSTCPPPRTDAAMQITEYVTSDNLYLSRRRLKYVSDGILKITHLKNLYLEGNEISTLPDTLFSSLSNLVWLDLRNNQLTRLPADIGQHRHLKTLLLEGNPINELPLELGNVITLKALSLRHCPISFPPQDLVQQGLPCILQFLRSAMVERPVSAHSSLPGMPPVEKLQLSELVKSSLDLCEEGPENDELRRFEELKQKMIQMEMADLGYTAPALSLSRHTRTAEGDRLQRAHPLPTIRRKKELAKGSVFPTLPPFDVQYWKRSEERRLAAMKELKEKQALLEQRRKDKALLREWRTQARVMQERKVMEHKQERMERHRREEVLNAPYGTDSTCKVGDSGEVMSHNAPQKTPLQRQRSFRSQKEMEEARAARDRELEQRIRSHVQAMQERRRRPRGTVNEEAEAARHEMQEVEKLQSELAVRKQERDLEYRFTAFTGENSPRCYDKK